MCSGPHQLTPEGPRPPVATLPRTHGPLIPDREALRASAHSLCSQHIHILLSIASYHYAQKLALPAKKWLAKCRESDRKYKRLTPSGRSNLATTPEEYAASHPPELSRQQAEYCGGLPYVEYAEYTYP
jgi:hypothetical protein